MKMLPQRRNLGTSISRLFWCLFLAGVVLVASSLAGPIPPPTPPGFPLPVPIAGESELTSFIFPLNSDITVDWMVINYQGGLLDSMGHPIPPVGFLYLYQIENTSSVAMNALSITMPPGGASVVLAAGVIPGDDLDLASAIHPAHAGTVNPQDDAAGGPFPLLNGEEGPFPRVHLTALLTSINVDDSNVTWTFNPLVAGRESDTLFLVATQPPVYGSAVAQDSTPPSPWGTLAFGGEPLPIPEIFYPPEPSSFVLLGMGAVAAAVAMRRRRRRKDDPTFSMGRSDHASLTVPRSPSSSTCVM